MSAQTRRRYEPAPGAGSVSRAAAAETHCSSSTGCSSTVGSGSGRLSALSASHRCIVPDWPMGSHATAMKPDADLSPPGVANLIAGFMDALELERATVVGNDTGGAISQILAANHPDRVERLVLTNCDTLEHFPPFPFNALPLIARVPGAFAALAVPVPDRAACAAPPTRRSPSVRSIPPSSTRGSSAAGKRRRGQARRPQGDRRPRQAAHDRRRRAAARLRAAGPLRLGARGLASSSSTTPSGSPAMLPDASIVEIEDARTFVSLDRPERLAEVIEGFVRERAQGRRLPRSPGTGGRRRPRASSAARPWR